MNDSRLPAEAQRQRLLLFSGVILAVIAALAGLWLATGYGRIAGVSSPADSSAEPRRDVSKSRTADGGGSEARGEEVASDSHPSSQSSTGTSTPPLQVLGNGKQTVDERVRQLQGMGGISLSKEERESALACLSGKEIPENMGKGSMQWLADELLTVMRLQDPQWDGLAEDLAKAAFQPDTDPVVRDYIMQHLGHLWEQSGPR